MPVPPTDKLIVTHAARLKAKYGPAGLTAVTKAAGSLIDADAGRGLKTALLDLGSKADMKKFGAAAVPAGKELDPKANKAAIDKLFAGVRPAYLVLLGAPDVVPHQELVNPVYEAGVDDDRTVPSDLPYACDAGFDTDVRKFTAPGRVVGRLPDVAGDTDPAYLAGLVRAAAEYTSRPAASYDHSLGVTADVWRRSTEASLRAVFGTAVGIKDCPPHGPTWTAGELGARSHFFNCHGAAGDPRFFGQKANVYPVAHDAALLAGRLTPGTVLAAECCYGAELYAPAAVGTRMGMCNTYLANGAYAYFGSSTIAYGPSDGNAQADLICQYFLRSIRGGASAGRACLDARAEYVKHAATLTPTDLKTLAQFNLMADPAATPVAAGPPAHLVTKGGAAKLAAAAAAADRLGRAARRATLAEVARAAAAVTPVAAAPLSGPAAMKAAKAVLGLAADAGLTNPSVLSFAVAAPAGAGPAAKTARALAAAAGRVHVVFQRDRPDTNAPVVVIRGLEVVEFDGSLKATEFRSR
jgi:hypothetical protein